MKKSFSSFGRSGSCRNRKKNKKSFLLRCVVFVFTWETPVDVEVGFSQRNEKQDKRQQTVFVSRARAAAGYWTWESGVWSPLGIDRTLMARTASYTNVSIFMWRTTDYTWWLISTLIKVKRALLRRYLFSYGVQSSENATDLMSFMWPRDATSQESR